MEGGRGVFLPCLLALAVVAAALPARGDTEPPLVRLVILDPGNGFRETSGLTEVRTYYFDASGTTDDSLNFTRDNVNLTYQWNFGDGTILGPGLGRDGLLNVSHSYARWGEYAFNLTVTDASARWSTRRLVIWVQANVSLHPNLSVVPASLAIAPERPETDQEFRVRVDVRNLPSSATARDVFVQFALRVESREINQSVSSVRLFDSAGDIVSEIMADAVVTVEFVVIVSASVGDYRVVVGVWDGNEPDSWKTDNRLETTLSLLPPITLAAFTLAVIGGLAGAALVGTLVWFGTRRRRRRGDVPPPPG